MLSINRVYSSIYERLKNIYDKYIEAENQFNASNAQDEILRHRRIDNLKAQLEKIDEYREKVEYFMHMAEKHIESKNLLTITPRELNFNRMRNWAMMIDPDETDDPYAQRIYVQAKCNEMFLSLKEEEFKNTLEDLENGKVKLDEEISASIETLKRELTEQCKMILEGDEFAQFSKGVANEHSQYSDLSDVHATVTEENKEDNTIGFGFYAQPLAVLEELKYIAKSKLGDYYDIKNNRILLPVEHPLNSEAIFYIGCTAAKEKRLYSGLQNYLLNIISKTKIGSRKIYILDALHYNSTTLGALKPLENTIAVEPIPRDAEQIVDILKQIVSSFSDIDESLGMIDTVAEFNGTSSAEDRLERSVLVLIGYPSAFSGEAKEYVRRILLNCEHYGITPVLIDTQYTPKGNISQNDFPVEAAQNLFRIQMLPQRVTICHNGSGEYHFKWYEFRHELPQSFIDFVKNQSVKANQLGNEYTKRINLENAPEYERGKKNIVLPYGIDSKDNVHSISFDNENFASYLMGASGSGKSTLLHTLITGIIYNYHPDDVELWLADFKMSEFAQYINPLPPHIKYILLDESPELVYDLLDKLTEKMMERQRFFMKYREMKKVENVPTDIYMPVIFVMLDEFSIMSQAIADSPQYKLKLQNLLAKGRALGIKFLFSSQTFLNGIRGLTPTAKAQIQSRIAMKNSKDEINETLELSSNLKTDQVKNWIDALPPHYALYKYRDGDMLQIKRLLVMYFAGKGEEAFAPQRKIIDYLNSSMQPVSQDQYNPEVISTYVNKDPVIVDGNSYSAFNTQQLEYQFAEYRQNNSEDITSDDILLSFGDPRRMSNFRLSCLSSETRENLLLVGRTAEQACTTSVILSIIKSCVMQDCNVQVWAYGKNRLFKAYKDIFAKCGIELVEGIDAVCDSIYALKQSIKDKETNRKMIVMIGMERIFMDFDFVDNASNTVLQAPQISQKRKEWENSGTVVTTEDEELKRQYALKWVKRRKEIIKSAKEEGKTENDIKEILQKAELELRKELGFKSSSPTHEKKEEQTIVQEAPKTIKLHESGAYNAKDDFIYILKQGSRLGYHFMLNLTNLSDLKQMNLKVDLFRYRMSFQVSAEDSRDLYASKVASTLPEHICQFDDTLDRYSFRPYLHKGLTWEGWFIDDNGEVLTPFDE